MAQIIDGGNLMFKSLMYGRPHPNTTRFIEQQFDTMSNTLTDAGRRFFEGARDLYAHLESSQAIRAVRAAGRAIRSLWQMDEIRPLLDIGQLQHAPLAMQRWVMAEPMTRDLFQKQQVDGYSDTYVDLFPGQLGENHYDWRRVMDGIVVEDTEPNESGECGWTATTYADELLADTDELMFEEQLDIIETWQHQIALLQKGKEDPTSRFNGLLG